MGDPSEVLPHPKCPGHSGEPAYVCACGLYFQNDRYRDVVMAAWELVLRGTSHTIKWGDKEKRLDHLKKMLEKAGTPAECGVSEPEMVYDWQW